MKTSSAAWYTLILLFLINTVNFFDRLIIGALGEPIRQEFQLGDASLGLLSTAFTLMYAFVGIPFGKLADTFSRKKILSIGVLLWSIFTIASGLAKSFTQIAVFRIGVGVGEASCAPAATSLIADLFPARLRARAMGIFMLGLPIGIALSFAVGGTVAQRYGWRTAFFVAGIPGIILAALALLIKEPHRDISTIESKHSPIKKILGSKTMLWLILSGALHNFCLYALSSFMTPYLMRYHELNIRDASMVAMVVNGVFTLPGLLLGGYFGDILKNFRKNAGLMLVAGSTLLAVPLFLAAVLVEKGSTSLFLITMGLAFALMYFYYSIVYAAIADVNLPNDRGLAMSVYFLAMYILGGALGPYVLGLISDSFTLKAAKNAGITDLTAANLEPFRSAGLQSAFFVVPILCLFLGVVMIFAAMSYKKDSRD